MAAEIESRGGRAWVAQADVTDAFEVDAAVSAAAGHGDLSICVNGAGTNRTGATHDYEVAEITKFVTKNLELLPGVLEISEVRVDALTSPVGLPLDSHHRGGPLEVRRRERCEGLDVPLVEGIYRLRGDVHVRPRHHLLPQPHGF